MPRKSRIDYPGALHHVIVRGLDRSELFRDNLDRETFFSSSQRFLEKTGNKCYAYALMPNHFHLLLVTGDKPISSFMQSLLTSYALYYNKRHSRSGKLYENRYRSILCDRDTYFLSLVRYIHLNPLKAGIVENMAGLREYRWTSHRSLMGNYDVDWVDVDEVLAMFGVVRNDARSKYEQFVSEGLELEDENLEGGGLVRSAGGEWVARQAVSAEGDVLGDERILGNSDFIEQVLHAAGESEERVSSLRRSGWDIDAVIDHAATIAGIRPEELRTNSKKRDVSKARAMACKWLVRDLSYSGREAARALGIASESVSALVCRGEELEHTLGAQFLK